MDASAHGPGQNFGSENLFGADGNDNIDVTLVGEDEGQAIVYGQGGDDTINVTSVDANSNDTASVYGGSGEDTITVTNFASAYVDGGADNDTINVTPEIGGQASVLGGTGDDTITITSDQNANVTIVGGAGNDTINVTNSVGVDTLEFGDISYTDLQAKVDNQGLDTITGYNWEAPNPGDPAPVNQDVMDFGTFFGGSPISGNDLAENAVLYAGSPFIPGSIVPLVPPTPAHNATWEHGVTVDANNNAGDSLVVLSTQNLELTGADFSVNQLGTIQLNDNARAVVVVGTNESNPGNGISEFDIYFVQDIDTGAGPATQYWVVDKVATVDSLTAVGINTVFQNLDNNWL
jgi:Ca2+-binding RTX toxin-like protein